MDACSSSLPDVQSFHSEDPVPQVGPTFVRLVPSAAAAATLGIRVGGPEIEVRQKLERGGEVVAADGDNPHRGGMVMLAILGLLAPSIKAVVWT
jgi:hypothetical protein